MKLICFLFFGAVLVLLFLVSGFRELHKRIPDELNAVTGLLSDEWRLVSWNRQTMGWLGKFEVRGRRFDVSSHRDCTEIYEIVSGGQRVLLSQDSQKSPEQIYELLSKAVA
jgi:hypothetical protein